MSRRVVPFLAAVFALATVMCVAEAPPTWARPGGTDEQAGADLTSEGAKVHAGEGSHVTPVDPGRHQPVRVSTGTGSGGPAHPITCTWFVETMAGGSFFALGDEVAMAIPENYLVLRTCTDDTDGHIISSDRIPWPGHGGGALAAPPVTGQELATRAESDLVLTTPTFRTWPAAGRALVGLETWFHLDTWAPQTQTADAGGVAATVTAVPVRAVWHLHEATLTCTGPGPIYDPATPDAATDCGYTFTTYSGDQPDHTFAMAVDLVYHLTWTATTGETGDLGEIARTTAFAYRVWELQAVIN